MQYRDIENDILRGTKDLKNAAGKNFVYADLTKADFQLKKKAASLMTKAYHEG